MLGAVGRCDARYLSGPALVSRGEAPSDQSKSLHDHLGGAQTFEGEFHFRKGLQRGGEGDPSFVRSHQSIAVPTITRHLIEPRVHCMYFPTAVSHSLSCNATRQWLHPQLFVDNDPIFKASYWNFQRSCSTHASKPTQAWASSARERRLIFRDTYQRLCLNISDYCLHLREAGFLHGTGKGLRNIRTECYSTSDAASVHGTLKYMWRECTMADALCH